MLFAVVGPQESTYSIFLQHMDPSLQLALTPNHIMDFVHEKAGRCCPPTLALALSPLGLSLRMM